MTYPTQFIDDLIYDLSHETFDTGDVYNQYAPDDQNNSLRCENLRHYLHEMRLKKPSYMLVMEAPGYRGCRLTGIPVTSRKIMLEGAPAITMFGNEFYQNTSDEGFENVYGEQSATIVWETLSNLKVTPIIWNTFPFHPRKGNVARSNRKPRVAETQLGAQYLHDVVDYFKPEVIVAAGNVAHETMMSVGINCVKVRHPAQGGKNDFVEGLTRLWGS